MGRVRATPACWKPRRRAATIEGWAIEIPHATEDGCVVVSSTGSIDLFSGSAVHKALRKDLAEQPYGLRIAAALLTPEAA